MMHDTGSKVPLKPLPPDDTQQNIVDEKVLTWSDIIVEYRPQSTISDRLRRTQGKASR